MCLDDWFQLHCMCNCVLVAQFVEYCDDSKEVLGLIPKEQTYRLKKCINTNVCANIGEGQVPNLKVLHCDEHSFTRAVVRDDNQEQCHGSCHRGAH